jgi:VanZ like family
VTARSVARAETPASRDGSARVFLLVLLGASLAAVAALTLTPDGTGWAWGAPLVELRWYVRGLDSPSTVTQLVGNLALLVVPAVVAVVLWPRMRRIGLLAFAATSVATGIELLQWILPLGRVVSPMDALLNTVGAVTAGLLTAVVLRVRARNTDTPAEAGQPPRARR